MGKNIRITQSHRTETYACISTRHTTQEGPRWAVDGHYLPFGLRLGSLLTLPRQQMVDLLSSLQGSGRGSARPPARAD